MSELKQAQERLEAALERLERAARDQAARDQSDEGRAQARAAMAADGALRRELEELRQRCRHLEDELAAASNKREVVREALDDAADRLDGSISEIDTLLRV